MLVVRIVFIAAVLSCPTVLCSFSYAKFERPDSTRVIYSIKHNDNDALQEYNLLSIPGGRYDSKDEPSKNNFLYDVLKTKIHPSKNEKMWSDNDDLELIKELYKPGRLGPKTKKCKGFCLGESSLWETPDCDGRPCYATQSRVKFAPDEKRSFIRFPENRYDSPRLNTRSRELGMSGKLRRITKTFLPIPAEIKYVTYEAIPIVPRTNKLR